MRRDREAAQARLGSGRPVLCYAPFNVNVTGGGFSLVLQPS